jgi:hypothetical protein
MEAKEMQVSGVISLRDLDRGPVSASPSRDAASTCTGRADVAHRGSKSTSSLLSPTMRTLEPGA